MVYNKNVLRKVRSHTLLIPVDGCRCRHYEMDYEPLLNETQLIMEKAAFQADT